MLETAYLQVTVKTNAIGKREAINYEWVGESPYVRIGWHLLSEIVGFGGGDRTKIQIGPYKLLRVQDDPAWDSVLYVRADKLGALRVALYKSTRLLDLFYRRLIVTLAVWNLAEFTPAAIPSWRDIKLIERLLKK
jgi:hypothetical protein